MKGQHVVAGFSGSRPSVAAVLLVVCACAEPGEPDGSRPQAEAAAEAVQQSGRAEPAGTIVKGAFKGSQFEMHHAALEPGDQLNVLCFSTAEITAPDCGYTDGVSKIVLYGEFLADDMGNAGWKVPLELRRISDVGSSFELSTEAELTLLAFDPGQHMVAAQLTVTFPSGVASGSVRLP